MKKIFIILAAVALIAPAAVAFASEPAAKSAEVEKQSHFKFYGFIRNYFVFDSRENKAGTKDLFYYLPKDESLNAKGEDVNANPSFRFLATVTISDSEALMASAMRVLLLNLPVPRNSRELNSLPAITNFFIISMFIILAILAGLLIPSSFIFHLLPGARIRQTPAASPRISSEHPLSRTSQSC